MTPYQNGTSDACTQPGRAKQQHCARQLALRAEAEAVGVARRATRDALTAWRMTHLEDNAILLVSELVTNVVRHAQAFPAFLVLRLETADAWLRIEVHDADPSWPRQRTPASLDESGFGIMLVHALADRWGVSEVPPGKAVWAELRARADGEVTIGNAW